MIKKSTLFSITGLFILLSYIISSLVIIQVPNVTVFSVDPQTVKSTVICGGTIEYCENRTVNSQYQGQINEIFISEGDCIKKGDKLYSVNIGDSKTNSRSSISVADIPEDELVQSVINGDTSLLDEYMGESIVVSSDESTNKGTTKAEEIIVYSDNAGVVGEIKVKPGSAVSLGSQILKIADADSMQAKLNVTEDKIGEIKTGQNAEVSCSALKNNKMSGSVAKIGNVAKQTATSNGKETSVEVIVKIDKGLTSAVKSGYTVKCSITVDSKDNAMILPYESIKYDDSGNEYVLCYSQNGICEKREIETGEEYKDGIEVLSGISTNEFIISAPDEVAESSFAKAREKGID